MENTLEVTIKKEQNGTFNFQWTYREGQNPRPSRAGAPAVISNHQRMTIRWLGTLQRMLAVALSSRGPSACRQPPEDFCQVDKHVPDVARTLGGHLFKILFADERMRDGLKLATNGIDNRPGQDFLRVVIDFTECDDAELQSWPWEYLYDEERACLQTRDFLTRQGQLILQRRMYVNWSDPESPGASFSVFRPVVLLVVSRPRGEGPVNAGGLLTTLRKLASQGLIQLDEVVQQKELPPDDPDRPQETNTVPIEADFESFKKALRKRKPDIIHFVGHGLILKNGEGGLVFMEPNNGTADPIPGEEFAREVKEYSTRRLVILQACESALADPNAAMSSVAQKLVMKNVYAVVGMQYQIRNEQGAAFAVTFYEKLATGSPIDSAVAAGCAEVERRDRRGDTPTSGSQAFAIPVLYLSAPTPLFLKEAPKGRQSTSVDTGQGRECPRCQHWAKKFCAGCGLRVQCEKCKELFADPLQDTFCANCGTRVMQEPYSAGNQGPSCAQAPPPVLTTDRAAGAPYADVYETENA